MRILQLTNSLKTGGAEKLLLESIPLYENEKVTVDLAILNGKNEPFLQKLQALRCCKIYILTKNSVYNPFNIFKILPLLNKYDLVHVHLFPALYWVALAKLFSFSKVKLIYTEHSTFNRRRNKILFRALDRFIYSRYVKIITISPEVDKNLKKHLRFKNNRFIQIQNGINFDKIARESGYVKPEFFRGLSNDSYILLQISSFRYPKNQKTVVRALQYLPDNIVLVLVGDGELKKDCQLLVEELGLTERVFFLGIRMDVYKLLKTADVIVLSSHYEGLSLSSLEGMASGKPFIASDVPGLSSIVKDAGLLFPKDDEKKLAQTIKELHENRSFYDSIVKKCLIRAEKYDIKFTVQKQVELYYSV